MDMAMSAPRTRTGRTGVGNNPVSLNVQSTQPIQRTALGGICFYDLAEKAQRSLYNTVLYLQPDQERSKNRKIERIRQAVDLTKAHAAGTDILLHSISSIPETHSLTAVLPEYARLLRLLSQRIDSLGLEHVWSGTLSRSGLTRFMGYVQISNRLIKDEPLSTLLRHIRRCQKRVFTKLVLCRKGQDDQVLQRRFSGLSLRTYVEPSPEARRGSTESLDSLADQMRGSIGSEILEREASEVFKDAPRLCHDRHLAFFLEESLGGDNMSEEDFKVLSGWLRYAQRSEYVSEGKENKENNGWKAIRPRALWESVMESGFTISQ
ncbi:hypothetical protein LIA77_06349 [Sarocladium implicatum]|nr:hypothetical protein LIA77_06349 [Sarocladium implicatum]